jgi:capsular polysaccharide export protein
MQGHGPNTPAGGDPSRRVFYFNSGFLTNTRVRRILRLAGYDLRLGKPGPGDDILVWGHSRYAARGEAAAAATGGHIVRVEDAFLRSLHPGRTAGEPPLGLTIDRRGAWFDSRQPSDLEHMLATHPLDDTTLLDRARDGIARMVENHLTKYAAVDPAIAPPAPGYVLVVDQTNGDASIRLGGARASTFREMLVYARQENPGCRIVIKTHPETQGGHRPGHYGADDCDAEITLCTDPISPWRLMEGAVAVYAVTSQLGFEAIFAGHKPRIFGQPFYAGWGLTEDHNPVARRTRALTRAQLFAAAMLEYPVWFDPYHDRLGRFEDALGALEARARAWREDRFGHVALGMRAWKRAPLQKVFGAHGVALRFAKTPQDAVALRRPVMVWAGQETATIRAACEGVPLTRIEDGFLRSRGLGADLIPPLSLVSDDLGIYYDPTRPSRLEALIEKAAALPAARLRRAEALADALIRTGLSKYNVGAALALDLPAGRDVVLVPGQVEDDASIRLGAGEIRTNLELLRQARALHPEAFLIYKPHPDVEAGLRIGRIEPADMAGLADLVAQNADPVALISRADRVVTMTSLLGFEALLRGVPVTCLGAPFYAGWGLTRDIGPVPARRVARPSLAALAHAVLIAYPRYFDPVTGTACPVEVAVDRLANDTIPRAAIRLRALAKLQGWFAGYAYLWR